MHLYLLHIPGLDWEWKECFNRLKSSSMPKVYFAVFIAIFFMSPVLKCVYSVAKADNVLRKSGNWLAANEMFHDAKLLTNDIRVPFFAGIKIDKYFIYSDIKDKYNFASMEKFALEKQADLLVVKVSSKETELLNNILYYKKLKKFVEKGEMFIFTVLRLSVIMAGKPLWFNYSTIFFCIKSSGNRVAF